MKYRHRGYKDTEWKDKTANRKEPPRPRTPEERQLRHMMERSATLVLRCHQCSTAAPADEAVGTLARCAQCGAALHVCRNCAHFDTGKRWECSAPITVPVADKTAANECDQFAANNVLDATGRRALPASPGESPQGARAAFDNLFKKK